MDPPVKVDESQCQRVRNIMPILSCSNPLESDGRVFFDEPSHTYWVKRDGEWARFPISVSSVSKPYFEEFDPDQCLDTYYAGWEGKADHKYGFFIRAHKLLFNEDDKQIRQHIKDAWKAEAQAAQEQGTHLHLQIEMFFNGLDYAPNPAWGRFEQWLKEWFEPRGWKPFRTELNVFSEQFAVAGQLDFLAIDPITQELHLIDWKCCKAKNGKPITQRMTSFMNRKGIGLCAHMRDTAYSHYQLQINMYKALFESQNPTLKIASMHLVQMHPEMQSYNCCEVEDCNDLVQRMLAEAGVGQQFIIGETPPEFTSAKVDGMPAASRTPITICHAADTLSKKRPLPGSPTHIVVDTETTDFNGHVISLAYIWFESGTAYELQTYHNFFRKLPGVVTSDGALATHHITDEYLDEHGLDARAELEKFFGVMDKVLESGGFFVAHNAAFDLKAINRTARAHGLDRQLSEAETICTMKMSKEHVGLKSASGSIKFPKNLELFIHLFGQEAAPAEHLLHDALQDARITKASFVEGASRGWW